MEAVLAFAFAGATLGLSGGLAPGPLTALVVRQSLTGGTREGMKVALAPLVTDGPLLLLGAFLATTLAEAEPILAAISLVGAGFLLFLAYESLQATELAFDPSTAPTGTVWKAIATNLLNPHPYVFWLAIGGPLVAQAASSGPASTAAFLTTFFGCLCGSKMAIAWAVGANRDRLSGPLYGWTLRALALALFAFALLFAWDGITRLL